MERITKQNTHYCKNICDVKNCKGPDPFDFQCSYALIYNRLADYEDTGISVAEIKSIKERVMFLDNLRKRLENIILDKNIEIEELLKALTPEPPKEETE